MFQAISKLGWSSPTPIQERAIPLALEGKDVLAQARTGSGKTGAFSIPVVQKILTSKQVIIMEQVLPYKELRHLRIAIKRYQAYFN